MLRVYRVISSNVSFLNSGNFLHTIFPRSQCWCVDGESKFALRIRQDAYYRIELPHETPEDKQKVEDFKAVLGQVLQYEKTPCPFTRGFVVELPERPKTPPPRKPRKAPEKAKKWILDKTWMPEGSPRPSTPVMEGSDSGTVSSCDEDDRASVRTDTKDAGSSSPIGPPWTVPTKVKAFPSPSVLDRANQFQGLRSVTAPLTRETRAFSQPKPPTNNVPETPKEPEIPPKKEDQNGANGSETASMVSSMESFQTAPQRRSPSPEYLDAETELRNPWADQLQVMEQREPRGRPRHRREISDITVRPHSLSPDKSAPRTPTLPYHLATPHIDVHPPSTPSTPPLISDSEESSPSLGPYSDVATPPDTIRLRRLTGATQRRAYSPMPNPQNLIRPQSRTANNALTSVVVRKACELILGPPAHLVTLMLNIAARISQGALRFTTYKVRTARKGERIPCSWESSDEEQDWEEDDFGIPLSNLSPHDEETLRRGSTTVRLGDVE